MGFWLLAVRNILANSEYSLSWKCQFLSFFNILSDLDYHAKPYLLFSFIYLSISKSQTNKNDNNFNFNFIDFDRDL